MNIAIIGSGIAGLTCAWRLAGHHQVTLFEAGATPGGHTATVDVATPQGTWAIDTGFIVYNDRTYPRFMGLLSELGIGGQKTQMSFSVHNPASGLEYNGHDLDSLFSARASLSGIALRLQPAADLPKRLSGDALRLGQILINLVGNALKFTASGEITVSARCIGELPDERLNLEFSVSDTGIGIPAEKQQEIFAPFLQADNSTSRRYGGSGLGLTISRRLVEAMGGGLTWGSALIRM